MSIDKGARVARRGGEIVDLTTVEFDLLDLLLRGAGRVIPRDELVRTVLRREFSPFDRSIDTHVSNLRRKLGPAPDGGERIKGVRGIGYQYALHERADRGRTLMHRLHVKIFLWFWLGVLVVSGTLVSLTELSHSRAEDDRRVGGEVHAAAGHVGAAGIADSAPRRPGGARTLRRLVRDGSRRA